MVARQVQEGGTVSAGDLHYIPLTGLLMAPITEIGPNWHQLKLDRPKVLLSSSSSSLDRTNLKSTATDFCIAAASIQNRFEFASRTPLPPLMAHKFWQKLQQSKQKVLKKPTQTAFQEIHLSEIASDM